MNYRRLGSSGLRVSELGLGSWQTYGHKVNLQETSRCIHEALDGGVNFFDTADTYGMGEAERFFGKVLSPLPRDRFVVSTKCFFPTSDSVNGKGLSRKHITESVKRSLHNLRLDHIDVLLCHRFDDDCPLEETVGALADLIRQGHLLYWGVSRWSAEQTDAAIGIAERIGASRPIGHQHWYNLLNPQAEETLFSHAHASGIGMIAYSPLAQGVLTGKYASGVEPGSRARHRDDARMMWDFQEETVLLVDTLRQLARANGFSLVQVALAWCLRRKEVSSVIMGASTAEQVRANLAAYGAPVAEELFVEMSRTIRCKRRLAS